MACADVVTNKAKVAMAIDLSMSFSPMFCGRFAGAGDSLQG
jgi:hypothetical protein